MDRQLIQLESLDHQQRVSLPHDCQGFLKWFDGSFTVEEIIAKEFKESSKLSLKNLFLALNRLSDENFLVEKIPQGFLGATAHAAQAIDAKRSLLARPLFEVNLASKIKVADKGFEFLAELLMVANLVLGVWGAYLLINDREMSYTSFLYSPVSGYSYSLAKLLLLASVLLNYKYLLKSLVQIVGFGQITALHLRVFAVGVAIAPSDFAVQKRATASFKNLYYLSSPLSYLALVGLLGVLKSQSVYLGDLKILALFLSFVMLNPLRRSDFTDLLERFLSPDRLKHFIPYLKGRALLAMFRRGAPIDGENALVLFSSLAMLWIVSFADFSIKILSQELPSLAGVLGTGQFNVGTFSALVITGLILLTVWTLVKDVSGLFWRHLQLPFYKAYHRIVASVAIQNSTSFDAEKVTDLIERTWLFEGYSREWISKLLSESRVQVYRKGVDVITQDSRSQEVYLLLSGSVDVVKRENSGLETRLASLSEGAVFGEMALLSDTPRTANIHTAERVEVLQMPVATFKKLFAGDAASQTILDRIALGQYLSSSKLFSTLPEESLVALSAEGQFVHFKQGEVLTAQNSLEQDLYLIVRGFVQILVNNKAVGTLAQGNFFGEISLFSKIPRSATVLAESDALVFKLSPDKFFRILARNPELGVEIEEIAEDRKEQLKWSASS